MSGVKAKILANRKKRDFKLLKKALREKFSWTTLYYDTLSNARVFRGEYRCAKCKLTYSHKSVEVDHIVDIRDVVNAKTWRWEAKGSLHKALTALVKSMFDPQNLQVLCRSCHREKTEGVPW